LPRGAADISKYAEARTATIRLADGSGTLAFEVTDDGRGFDPGSTGYGTGLQGMADRLDALGGSLEVRSTPGRGTTVAGRVPQSSGGAGTVSGGFRVGAATPSA
jgi:two-component system sensor histidine kinase UhpB